MSLKPISQIVQEDISANAPDYENNIRSKMPGFNLIIVFPTCPIDEEKYLSFPAYVKKVNDSFTPSYDPKSVYGRMDPIPTYQRTTRVITLDLLLPSNGLDHSREISKKLNKLVRNLYPSYQKNGFVNVISSPPLARMFLSNIIYNGEGESGAGLLGYFNSSVSITHDLAAGVFSRDEGFETYAKVYELGFTFNVLHEFTPDFINNNGTVTNQLNILKRLT